MKNPIIVVMLLSITPSFSYGSDLTLSFGHWSTHIGSKITNESNCNSYCINNEEHQLFGIEYNSFEAGTFINSYSERSFYAGYRWSIDLSQNTYIGTSLGIVHGYNKVGVGDYVIDNKNSIMPYFTAGVYRSFKYIDVGVMIAGTAVVPVIKVDF